MGATSWEAITPYEESPEQALRKAQVRFFGEAGHDIPKFFGSASARLRSFSRPEKHAPARSPGQCPVHERTSHRFAYRSNPSARSEWPPAQRSSKRSHW